MKLNIFKKEVKNLRQIKGNLIHVSNMEWYSLFKDEIRNSIAIEGVFTNRTDLIDVLENHKRTDKQKTAAILGYFESASAMYEYAVNQYKENEFLLRISDVKQIHTLLMRYEKEMGFYIGELGDFRTLTAEVSQSTFTPINEFYVRSAMEILIEWINYHLDKNIYDPIEVASIAHVWFESIHPFRDGNGRSGRILLSYILIGCGLLNIAIKGVSKKDRSRYYDALEKADDVFEYIHREMENGKKFRIKDVDKLINKDSFLEIKTIVLDCLNGSLSCLQEIDSKGLDKEARLSLNELAKVYHYSPDYLRNLINRRKLKGFKKGKTWYVRVQDMADYANKKTNLFGEIDYDEDYDYKKGRSR